MKRDYYRHIEDQENGWLTTYLDIIMLILTFFVFLTTFTVQDRDKVSRFRDFFKKSLVLSGSGTRGAVSIADSERDAAVEDLIKKVKVEGLNIKLTNQFLEISEIKDLKVKDGNRGVIIAFPQALVFEGGRVNSKGREYLRKLAGFVSAIPYFVELKGVCGKDNDEPLAYTAAMGMEIYRVLTAAGVAEGKLKVTGTGGITATENQESADRVELNIREEF